MQGIAVLFYFISMQGKINKDVSIGLSKMQNMLTYVDNILLQV